MHNLVQKLVVALLTLIGVGVVAVVVMVYIAVSRGSVSCEDDGMRLCVFEQYFQERIAESLDAKGSAAVADIYGRAWDSACVVLPYNDTQQVARHCTSTFQCVDRLAEVVDKQYWRNNDQLWGLVLFSQCRFVLAARFELDRLEIDYNHPDSSVIVDKEQSTQIRLVEPIKVFTGQKPQHPVVVVLGSD